ncbi:hypothetical protein VTI74DRAFT_1802 [Chaetomium olivicolor]
MTLAGQYVEQRFGNGEASDGGLLFQGHVSGPLHIHHETRAKQHVAQRIIPFPRNEDVVYRDIFAAVDRLLNPPRPTTRALRSGDSAAPAKRRSSPSMPTAGAATRPARCSGSTPKTRPYLRRTTK